MREPTAEEIEIQVGEFSQFCFPVLSRVQL
jgi:hypothetical protein